jgi:hypothetical protein
MDGAITGLDNATIRVGELSAAVDWSNASKATIELYDVSSVEYTLTASQGGREIARFAGRLGIEGSIDADQGVNSSTEYPLPGTIRSVSAGGDGRWLVLHLPALRKLAVFDVTTGKITGDVDLSEENVLFAAGLEKLIVILPAARKIERWNLRRLACEASAPLLLEGEIASVALGSAAKQHLAVLRRDQTGDPRLALVDIGTFKASEFELPPAARGGASPDWLRASSDGTVFTFRDSRGRFCTLRMSEEPKLFVNEDRSLSGYAVPGPQGNAIFTTANIVSVEGRSWGSIPKATTLLPARHGPFFVGYVSPSESDSLQQGLAIFGPGDTRRILLLPDVATDLPAAGGQRLPIDMRIHLVPKARLLAAIPASGDRVVLHPADIDAALRECEFECLFVSSSPPAVATKGTTLRFPLDVKSKSSGLKFELIDGPQGMSVSDKGVVTWRVPTRFAAPEASAVILIANGSGEERLHTFQLRVR